MMSKIIINILDKLVWMLIITVITTQALQIAGVVDGPTKLGEISYPETKEYEFQITSNDGREKRQTQERLQVLDNIFNIPIATLNSVNELIQSTRRLRLNNLAIREEFAAQNQNQNQNQNGGENSGAASTLPRRRISYRRQRLNENYPNDGSSSRVLLNVN